MTQCANGARSPIEVVIVTGMSGAGKTTALDVFEDMGFFSVDGLPVSMIPKLTSLYEGQETLPGKGLVLGLDIRQQDFLRQWQDARNELQQRGMQLRTIFLEADFEELMRRYATTRRPHPLESEQHGLRQALEMERKLLDPVRQSADLVLDTTHYSIHDLRRALQEKWVFLKDAGAGMRVHLISFGFKHGPPKEADLVFDVRFLPNPYFVEPLRPLTGKDPAVAAFVLDGQASHEFSERFIQFLKYVIPLYATEGRYRLTIGIGCTGGRHRSVAMAEKVARTLRESGLSVSLEHRHMGRS